MSIRASAGPAPAVINMLASARGRDIAFLGGLINYVLTHERWFKPFVETFTNAAVIIDPEYQDTEDLEGIFSGYDAEKKSYQSGKGHWDYAGSPSNRKHKGEHGDQQPPTPEQKQQADENSGHGMHGAAVMGGASSHESKRSETTIPEPERDLTLQHPSCVMQLLRKHFARYTPQMVAEICGCSAEELEHVAKTMADNSGPDRTSAIVYAVGWTQHSVGPQIIRAAGILQLLLGNIGRPGGMIMAMRGHCSIQGSTDIPTLYDLLPGYLPQPVIGKHHEKTKDYSEYEGLPTGYWANTEKFIVSLLKAYYGEAATPANDFHFDWLPRIDGDYSQQPTFDRMTRGEVEGYFIFGQNPAAGGPNSNIYRAGLRKLKWLVVADWFETETACFWKNDPKGPPAEDIGTEVFFIPAASIAAKEGSFTNTQRLLQWHDKAVDPEEDTRSDLWFVYNLGKRLRQMYATSDKPQDQAIKAITWSYDYDQEPLLPNGRHSTIEGEAGCEQGIAGDQRLSRRSTG